MFKQIKLYIGLLILMSMTLAEQVESDTEKFECYARYLRDNKLLDNNFKEFTSREPRECDESIKIFRDVLIEELIETLQPNEETPDKFGKITSETAECLKEHLISLKYPEDLMKNLIYSEASKISKNQNKKHVSAADFDSQKKLKAALSVCIPEVTFGELFDELIAPEKEETDLDEMQKDYCIRKYVAENDLINTKVNLNPKNINLNFNCDDEMDKIIEMLEGSLKDDFEYEGHQSKGQSSCVDKTVKNEKGFEKLAKVFVLSEIELTDDQKVSLKTEFIEGLKKLYLEMIKCFA